METSVKTPSPGESISFEKCYGRLESIVRDLERGELTLDESLARYEEGVACLQECHRQLRQAEARILVLVERADGRLAEEEMAFKPTSEGSK